MDARRERAAEPRRGGDRRNDRPITRDRTRIGSACRSRGATSSSRPGFGIGGLALASLHGRSRRARRTAQSGSRAGARAPHFAPKAKRVIYLFMAGAPSQLDLFDHKPELQRSTTARTSPRSSSRASGSRSSRARRKLLGSPFTFQKHGQSGAEISELLPHLAKHRRRHRHRPLDADDAVQPRAGADLHEHRPPGHRPAEHRLVAQLRARQREQATCPPSSCCSPGENNPDGGKSCWGSGFLPTVHQGVEFRSKGEPVLFVVEPRRRRREARGASRSTSINDLNRLSTRRRRRSRDRRRASPRTSWRTGCRRACPS